MNIHYFKHVPFEGLGSLDDWTHLPGNNVTATKFYEDFKLPFVDICDLLIVMGGPMGVYDEDEFPWLAEEKKFIEKAIAKGKKVVGICLGAQLVAEVLGAKVYKNAHKEIGWMPVELTEEGKKHRFFGHLPTQYTTFHWHGDTFDLPPGAIHLAKSQACTHQAFVYNDQVIGLQYHMEVTADTINALYAQCANEITEAPFIQREEQIKNTEFIEHNNKGLVEIMNRLVGL